MTAASLQRRLAVVASSSRAASVAREVAFARAQVALAIGINAGLADPPELPSSLVPTWRASAVATHLESARIALELAEKICGVTPSCYEDAERSRT